MFVYLCLTVPPLCNELVFTPNIKSATTGYNLNFNILPAFFPLLISIKHSGKNNDLASHDVTARLFKEFLEI